MNETSRGGVGFLGLLGIAFIVLKLCHVIDWSWWYVTLPLYGPPVLLLVCAGLLLFLAMLLKGIVYIFGGTR